MSPSTAVALCIPPGHPALPGHFPGHPVVPGVVLLERVAAVVRERFDARVEKLDAKFLQPLLPGEAAQIVLQINGARIRFEISKVDGTTLARGVLTAVPRGDAPRQGAG